MSAETANSERDTKDVATLLVRSSADMGFVESGGSLYLVGDKSAWESMERAAKDMQGKDFDPTDDTPETDSVHVERETLEELLNLVYMYRGDERVEHDAEMEERFSVVHDAEDALEGSDANF